MIRPVGTKLVVETITDAASSLLLLNPEKPQHGIVRAVGGKVNSMIQVGTKVSFARHAGVEIKEEQVKYLILEEKDILAYE